MPDPFIAATSCRLHSPIRLKLRTARHRSWPLQYITVLSVTWTGEPASNCALPRATSQPSARSRRATICSVGEAVELAGRDKEKAIVFDLPSLLTLVFAARRRALP